MSGNLVKHLNPVLIIASFTLGCQVSSVLLAPTDYKATLRYRHNDFLTQVGCNHKILLEEK